MDALLLCRLGGVLAFRRRVALGALVAGQPTVASELEAFALRARKVEERCNSVSPERSFTRLEK